MRGIIMNNTMVASVLNLDRKAVKELKITDPYSIHRVVTASLRMCVPIRKN